MHILAKLAYMSQSTDTVVVPVKKKRTALQRITAPLKEKKFCVIF